MKTLVVGASGATGKHLVNQLLEKDLEVRIIVRSKKNVPENWANDKNVNIIEASILDIDHKELTSYVKDCNAIFSCLGHNLTFKGIYGKPRKLVTNTIKNLVKAIQANEQTSKIVLMNTSGNRNKDLNENFSFGERLVVGLIRLLLPPHSDNEQAAEYLRSNIGQNDSNVEWVVVRPDSLIDKDEVTDYQAFTSPITSPIFNPGKTSRINVAHFMTSLATNNKHWEKWKGQMPVLYNSESIE